MHPGEPAAAAPAVAVQPAVPEPAVPQVDDSLIEEWERTKRAELQVRRDEAAKKKSVAMQAGKKAIEEFNAKREGDVQKHYLALVVGDWQFGDQVIDKPLLVQNRKGGERHVVVSKGGKPAQTEVSLSRTFGKYSLLVCSPQTGRTHQIRVHLQHLGCPLVGDPVYGGRPARQIAQSTGYEAPRQMLHAAALGFTHPLSGKKIEVNAPLPADFADALNFLKTR